MKSARMKSRMLVACAVTFALAACAGLAPQGSGSTTIPANPSAHGAKSQSLLYLTDVKGNTVAVYSYPNGALVTTLTGFGKPRSECADSAGDVWIADVEAQQVEKFTPGAKKPVVALSTQGTPSGCSVSPIDGDVAVAGGPRGIVLSVFHRTPRNRWRDAKVFTDKTMATGYFCGYDAQGNLFVDGRSSSGDFHLAELPHLGKALVDIAVSQTIKLPGQVQWDGTHLAVGDTGVTPSLVYQFSIVKSKASKTGTTTLSGSTSVRQFWIAGDKIIGPDNGADVKIWAYPAGGSPTKTISVAGYGAAVSAAQ